MAGPNYQASVLRRMRKSGPVPKDRSGDVVDQERARTDRVLLSTRVLAAAIVAFLVLAFPVLVPRPTDTTRLFAWEIHPTMSPIVLADPASPDTAAIGPPATWSGRPPMRRFPEGACLYPHWSASLCCVGRHAGGHFEEEPS